MKNLVLMALLILFSGCGIANGLNSQDETDALISGSLSHAKNSLDKRQDVLPYGSAVMSTGQPVYMVYEPNDNRSSQELFNILDKDLNSKPNSEKYEISAIFYDAFVKRPNTGERVEAIAVKVSQNSKPYSQTIAFPYRLVNDNIIYDEQFTLNSNADATVKARRITTQSRGLP